MKWTHEAVEKFRGMYMNGATYKQLAFEFGVTVVAAQEVRRRHGMPPIRMFGKKSAPSDLSEVVDRIGVTGAREHYSVGWATLHRWVKETGITVNRHKRFKTGYTLQIPEDWGVTAPTMFKGELAKHYRISAKAVNRIIEMTGVGAKKIVAKPKEPKPRKPRVVRRFSGWKNPQFRVFDGRAANNTLTQQAASFLRRLYPNVHRCDILMREGSSITWGFVHGVPNGGRGYYRVGTKTMTEMEMVNHALERGMDA